MKKDDLIARLTAAGIDIPDGATVAILTQLANDRAVSLTEVAVDAAGSVIPPFVPDPVDVALKVATGLTKDQAIEVLLAQHEHDTRLGLARDAVLPVVPPAVLPVA